VAYTLSVLTPSAAPLPATPAAEPKQRSVRWALIALVMSVQVLILAGGIAVFAAVVGAQGPGGCGGG
jgi:hypothetical protein